MTNKTILGETPATDARKDAIHIAIAPCIAHEKLNPGQRVTVNDGEARSFTGLPGHRQRFDGIVDPFLANAVKPGELFWILLRPGTVENLRHEWDHDGFPAPEEDYSSGDDGCRGC